MAKAKQQYTKADAVKTLRDFFLEHCPRPYLQQNDPGSYITDPEASRVSVSWYVCWGIEVRLSFSIDEEPQLSWSSSSRTVTQSLVAINLYKMALDFAAVLEMKRQDVLGTVKRSEGYISTK